RLRFLVERPRAARWLAFAWHCLRFLVDRPRAASWLAFAWHFGRDDGRAADRGFDVQRAVHRAQAIREPCQPVALRDAGAARSVVADGDGEPAVVASQLDGG